LSVDLGGLGGGAARPEPCCASVAGEALLRSAPYTKSYDFVHVLSFLRII